MRLLRRAAAAVMTALLVSSCTSGTPDAAPTPPAESSSSAAPSASPTPTRTPVPAPPKADGCYRLTFQDLLKPSNEDASVSCARKHTAQTIHVGHLRTAGAEQKQMSRVCTRQLAGFVGGTASDRNLSRIRVVWFSPTPEQSDAGAGWFRCDLIAFAAKETLLALPPTGALRGALTRSNGLDTYGLCGTAAPGAKNFERVACSRPHSWQATSTIHLAGGANYPGERTVRRAGDSTCRDRIRKSQGNSLKFQYGWEWPTRQQWDRGQHYGFCWAPS